MKELKKSKDKSYTVKTAAHIAIGFALSICYSKDIKCKKYQHFCYREDCLEVFAEKIDKILNDFAKFPRQSKNNSYYRCL